jgi:hypothetical protein
MVGFLLDSAIVIRIPFIDIRQSFGDFVELFGGQVTDRIIKPTANQALNPDYIFANESGIAELKCLEEYLEPT